MKKQLFFTLVILTGLILTLTLQVTLPSEAASTALWGDASAQAAPIIDGNVVYAASCEYDDVSDAIDNATYGDTVVVPAGSCTWDSTLVITKGITLQGAGYENTIIRTDGPSGYDYSIVFNADQTTAINDYPFRLSGFTFQQVSAVYGCLELKNQYIENALTKVAVHDNRFIGRGVSATHIGIVHRLGVFGVIYNNIIQDVSHAWRFLGSSTGWTQVEEWAPGSSNAMYYEDNYLYLSEDVSSSLMVSGGGGNRYVARYNTIDLSIREPFGGSAQSYDIHGNQYNNPSGGIGLELYGNLRIGTRGRWIDQRGGQVFFFYNQWKSTDDGYTGSINIWEEYDDDDFQTITWPEGSRYGRTDEGNIMQRPINSYYWRNYGGINGDIPSSALNILFDHYHRGNGILNDPLTMFENSNWFRDNTIAFDGTIDPVGSCGYYGGHPCTKSGVGCGTLAEMNAINPGLGQNIRVGFWATDQSCSDLTGMVGENPTTPISGTLYRWSGSEWEAYYTPYTYPHPLRGDITPPALVLRGAPQDQAIHLNWAVSTTLPVTSTWRIDYYTQTATAPFSAAIPLSATRSTVLTEHVDTYQWYTVTLHAMLGQTSWLSDTVRVMPTDRFVYLPVVMREH
jgi:hypothetical protein